MSPFSESAHHPPNHRETDSRPPLYVENHRHAPSSRNSCPLSLFLSLSISSRWSSRRLWTSAGFVHRYIPYPRGTKVVCDAVSGLLTQTIRFVSSTGDVARQPFHRPPSYILIGIRIIGAWLVEDFSRSSNPISYDLLEHDSS